MFSNGYVGTAEDAARIRRQEKQREEQRKKFEALAKESKDRADGAGLRQFGHSSEEALENAFKNETVGLVTKAEFVQKRTTLQERLEEEQRRKEREAEETALREKEKRRREKEGAKPKLSFMLDEDGGEEDEEEPVRPRLRSQDTGETSAGEDGQALKKPKLTLGKVGKNPFVKTDFLPDRDRERAETELRQQLKKEWQERVDEEKAEPLTITYSYWDGSGHRREITVKKGDSIGGFLKAVRDQLAPEFRELRATSVDNLMYIKEDLIMPQHYTFYELIVSKARGKSGPLFDFGVHEDIRVVNDASREKQDSHAGKVVERHWYEKNKHIFPASRWETYDPEKKYDSYSIYG